MPYLRISLLTLALFFAAAFQSADDKVGTPAPLFTGHTPAGDEVSLESYRGKVVILDVWASWCGPCREEMPFLNDLYRNYKDQGLEVIAVNIDDEAENMEAFLKSLDSKPKFTIVFDPDKKVPQLYDVAGMPTSVFIDREGVIRYMQSGFRDSHRKKYFETIETLLRE